MLIPLVLGGGTILVSMSIQVVVVVMMIRYLFNIMHRDEKQTDGFGFETYVISMVLLMLFAGHMVQIGIWAVLFMFLGEFSDFQTAFYHSMVNFASLGIRRYRHERGMAFIGRIGSQQRCLDVWPVSRNHAVSDDKPVLSQPSNSGDATRE